LRPEVKRTVEVEQSAVGADRPIGRAPSALAP